MVRPPWHPPQPSSQEVVRAHTTIKHNISGVGLCRSAPSVWASDLRLDSTRLKRLPPSAPSRCSGSSMGPWCLPGALQAVQLILSCLPGASQAVEMVLSYLRSQSQLGVPRTSTHWMGPNSTPGPNVTSRMAGVSFRGGVRTMLMPSPKRSMGLEYMPISWSGARVCLGRQSYGSPMDRRVWVWSVWNPSFSKFLIRFLRVMAVIPPSLAPLPAS